MKQKGSTWNLKTKKNTQKIINKKNLLFCLHLHAHGHLMCSLKACTPPHQLVLTGPVCGCVSGVCAGDHPAQSQPHDPTLRHHDRLRHITGREPEVVRTMLLVLAISLKDNKRQQKGFQRECSNVALYPLSLGYWFKYEMCTAQEQWQTSTSLSFFIFFSSFRPNLKELRVTAD